MTPPQPGTAPAALRFERWALLGILALAALLRLWQLDQNGFGREYYAASVRSMLGSWHNFFYLSFDPAGFVSLDKPPLALWLQVASARLLGFSAFSVMLPQVLAGVASVALVHRIVAPRAGPGAGLAAALFLAITPICVAVDRSNNTDSALILVLLLATWALLRAIDTGSGRRLVLALALVGLAFNVKMAAALPVLPGFVLAYLLCANGPTLRRRVGQLALGGAVLVGVALSWVTVFDLTPPEERPYAGSTHHNSMLELALMHNLLERFGSRGARAASAPETSTTPTDAAAAGAQPDAASDSADTGARRSGPRPALYDHTPVGPLRLLRPHLAAQMAWWLPLSLAGIIGGLGLWRRLGIPPAARAQAIVWTGWLLCYGIAFSFAGGVFHTYYLAVLGPPLAALAGIGWAGLWPHAAALHWRRGLPALLLLVAAWQLALEFDYLSWRLDDWRSLLLAASAAGLLGGGVLLLRARRSAAGSLARAGAGLGLAAMLATPLAWALSTVLVRSNVAAPAADIAVLDAAAIEATATRAPRRSRARGLVEYLVAQQRTERFVLAVPNALQAAPFIVRTGLPVMAMGGYLGRDPILTPADLQRLVERGELRFVALGGFALVPPDTPQERAVAEWIRSHGRRVDSASWRDPGDAARPASTRTRWASSPLRLYDLRPEGPPAAEASTGSSSGPPSGS